MLIALKADGRVYLAYNLRDLNWANFGGEDYLLEDNLPLWKVKKDCIMGFDGEFNESDFLRYDPKIFAGEINLYTLYEKIVPSMLKKLSDLRRLSSDGDMFNDYVLAQGDKGYYIYGTGEIEELDDYFCIGKGGELAQSTLDMTANLPAIERIKAAYLTVEAAEGIPAFPFAVMDTKSQKAIIIEKA